MNFIDVGKENSCDINLYYEDYGKGRPVVLIHGWPLSCASWEKQITALLQAGYRVITYDRRGFGKSSRPATGYDYDTLAEDLNYIMTDLNVEDATLIGFSMGGGEVARYLELYGSKRVSKAVFIAALGPFLLKTPDNSQGLDGSVFEGIKKAIAVDRPAYLYMFLSDFYNYDILAKKLISERVVQSNWNVAVDASAKGTLECVSAWLTDFREDLKNIDIPVLVIHGDADRILPLSASGQRIPEFVKTSRLVKIKDGPHGIIWTHAEQVNRELLNFIAESKQKKATLMENVKAKVL